MLHVTGESPRVAFAILKYISVSRTQPLFRSNFSYFRSFRTTACPHIIYEFRWLLSNKKNRICVISFVRVHRYFSKLSFKATSAAKRERIGRQLVRVSRANVRLDVIKFKYQMQLFARHDSNQPNRKERNSYIISIECLAICHRLYLDGLNNDNSFCTLEATHLNQRRILSDYQSCIDLDMHDRVDDFNEDVNA